MLAFGHGDIAAVVEATGISKSRIRAGIADLHEQLGAPPEVPARRQRVRRPGAGRPPVAMVDTTLVTDLDRLVEPVTRGDPESPLRRTCKSKDKLAAVGRLLGSNAPRTRLWRVELQRFAAESGTR